jgi:hypothetical protein
MRVSKRKGEQIPFVAASSQLNPGGNVGLVGPNSADKEHKCRRPGYCVRSPSRSPSLDPETGRETSSFKNGKYGLPSEGIPHVIVNGTTVVRDRRSPLPPHSRGEGTGTSRRRTPRLHHAESGQKAGRDRSCGSYCWPGAVGGGA